MSVHFQEVKIVPAATDGFILTANFSVDADVVFELDLSIEWIRASDGVRLDAHNLRQQMDVSWLPRGNYSLHFFKPRCGIATGEYLIRLGLWQAEDLAPKLVATHELPWQNTSDSAAAAASWQIESQTGTTPIDQLSWRKGETDWFFKHFDHAARTSMSYMLGDSPLLKGRILDVGCGDGITDLGIVLRKQPELLIGIDPFKGYERLLEVAREAHLPLDKLPHNLRFMAEDANHLPFEDDSFDVVISWGSVEHIVGGYGQAMREIKRVLKPDGLLFAHPGLFFSNIGHHLGEFEFAQREAYVHLTRTRDELRDLVLNNEPQRMDRSGHIASSAEYWQWFTELNPITTTKFEQELRALDFELWRVAVRTHDRVDYNLKLQPYPIMDLAVAELYVSAYNRKTASPKNFIKKSL